MRLGSLTLVLLVAALANAQPPGSDALAGFQQLSALEGSWEGQYEWTGARTGTGKMDATNYLTGNSSALVENLLMEGVPVMTSVYHLDNSDLRVTHFCAARNQPRLKASRIDLPRKEIDFALVDVTNVPSLDAPFVHGLEVRFAGPDQVSLTFLFESAGKKSSERIDLKRVGTRPGK
jgi:hypothetical protein